MSGHPLPRGWIIVALILVTWALAVAAAFAVVWSIKLILAAFGVLS